MRISDWSSDVCSSDLIFYRPAGAGGTAAAFRIAYSGRETQSGPAPSAWPAKPPMFDPAVATPIIAPPPAPLPLAGTAGAPPADPPALPQSAGRPDVRNSGPPLISRPVFFTALDRDSDTG